MLGLPTGGRIEGVGDRFNQVFYHAVFLQDDWKVSDRLTLNLGLRYEYEGAPTERFDRNIRGFDPEAMLDVTAAAEARYAANPIPEVPASQFRARGGVRFLDDEHRGFWNPDLNNFQPRVGVAYQLNGKTLVRGGWAIYTQPSYVAGSRQLGFDASTPLTASEDAGRTFRATLFNPFPAGLTAQQIGQSFGPNTEVGNDLDRFFDDSNFVNPQIMRWVIGIQRELPGRVVAEVSYVASRGHDLRTDVQLSPIPSQYLSRSPIRDQATIDYLNTTSVPNPFAGLLPGTSSNGTSTQRHRLLRPYPQFTDIESRRYDGSSRYDSMQLKFDRRMHKGLSILTTYTYSRSFERLTRLNEADTEYEERPTRSDVPHRIVINPLWELPFGRDRAIGRTMTGRSTGSLAAGIFRSSMRGRTASRCR